MANVKMRDKLGPIVSLLRLRGKLDKQVNVKGEMVRDVREPARAEARKLSTPQLVKIVALLDQIAAIEAEP